MIVEAAVVFYFVLVLGIGVYFKKKGGGSSIESFALADRGLGPLVLIGTIVATFYGASAVLGGASLAYELGLGALWFMVPFYLGSLFLVFFLGKIRESGAFSLPDFLGKYYGNSMIVATSVLLGFLCLVPESIIAGGKVMSVVWGLPVDFSMAVMSLVVVGYTLTGGMRAVSVSDLLQFVLMLSAVLVAVPFAVSSNPSFFGAIPSTHLDPFAYLGLQEILVFCVLLFFFPLTSAPLFQRFFSSKDTAFAKKALVASVSFWFLIDAMVLLSGLVAFSAFPALEDPDQAFILLGGFLPPYLSAVFYVGLLAAIMSTADSFLHTGASSLAYDVLGKRLSGEKNLVLASRVLVVFLGAVSLVLALWIQDIIPALLFLMTVWISGVTVPTLLALFGKKASPEAALASLLFGSLGALAWNLFPSGLDPLFFGLSASVLGFLAVEKTR